LENKKAASDYPFYDLGQPIAVAHRGGDAAGPENQNTLAAFDSASRQGFVYGETDVVTTSDGVPIISHDSVKDLGPEKLTFEELLVTFPEMRFFIDVKTPEAGRPLTSLVSKLHAEDRVSLRGLNYRLTKELAESLGGPAAVSTCSGKLGMTALRAMGNFSSFRSYGERMGATSFHFRHNKVTAKMIEAAHDLGMHVILWTPDTQETIEAALDKGADGVMSNKTEQLKQIILSRYPGNQSIRSS
jgi:glycerophosphoryl diester phosphodiesterase